jgi:tetratricopeptide (TPR) repeat protein
MTSQHEQGCDLRRDALHQNFDNEPNAPDVAGHVAHCVPCSDALSALQTQRDAVQFLSGPEAGADISDRTAIEQILAATARTGREKLADLLYELAKACLIVLPDLKRRIERKAEPREAPLVAGELRTINSRLEASRAGVALDGVPAQTPEEARALGAADACLHILENVEGETERQQLALSQVLLFRDQPTAAEQLLQRLLQADRLLKYRDLVQRNTILSMIRQEKYAEAVELGEDVLAERPGDSCLLFNLAVAYAHLRDLKGFDRVAAELAASMKRCAPSWLVTVLRYEIPRFAEDLDVDQRRVDQCFAEVSQHAEGDLS